MKQRIIRLVSTALLMVLALGVICMGTASAATTKNIGESALFTFNYSNLGYVFYFTSYPTSSDTSIAYVTSADCDDSGLGSIYVKAAKPGTVTISGKVGAYGTYGDTLSYSFEFTLEVLACETHSWTESVITDAGTCTEGKIKKTCTVCSEVVYEKIEPEHDYDEDGDLTEKPTPDKDGAMTYTCTLCGETKTEPFSKDHAVHLTAAISDSTEKIGSTAKVYAYAKGDGLKYRWYVKDRTASKFTKSSITSNVYSVKMTESNTGRQIYCVITDQYGNSQQTGTATLYSNKMITKQPSNASAYRDDAAKVSVSASGYVLDYQWYYKDPGMTKFGALKNQTWESYSCVMNDKNNGRQVYCMVTNLEGHKEKSNIVTLTMKPDKPVYIREQPVGVSRYAGEKAGVSVVATGKDKTYRWYYKDPGMSSFAKSSVTTDYYSVTMNESRENRQVYCVIKDAYGNKVQSNTVTLKMKRAAKITTQPRNASAYNGKTVTVSLKAVGDGKKYTWYYKDANSTEFKKSSVKTASYSMSMNAARAGRQVYCVVKDQYGGTAQSNTVTLSMKNKITIETQPSSVTGVRNQPVSVSVKAAGSGLTYRWYYKDPGMSSFQKSSITSATYSVKMSEARDGRQLYCRITDKYGLAVKTNTVTLNYDSTPIEITKQPSTPSHVGVGENTSVSVVAEGNGLTYRWYYMNRNGTKFAAGTQKTATYSMEMTLERSHRKVYCKITDQYGNSITTDTVTLPGPGVITITKQPQSVTTWGSSGHEFSVSAEGHGLKCVWHVRTYGYSYGEWKDTSYTEEDDNTGNYFYLWVSGVNNPRISYTNEIYAEITDSSGYSVETNTVYFRNNH